MKAFYNVKEIVTKQLGIVIADSVTGISIQDVNSDILNQIPTGTEYNSDAGYIYPGYEGENIILLYPDGQTRGVEWEGTVNCRNSYDRKGERVIDTILRYREELGLPKAILVYNGHDCGERPDEWTLTVYLWGTVGEGLLREITGRDETRVLKALDYPWRQQSANRSRQR